MSRKTRIEEILTKELNPDYLHITDDSKKHEGHKGVTQAVETHFRIKIVSPRFNGLDSVQRHKLVYAILQDEFATGLHALQLITKAPEEF